MTGPRFWRRRKNREGTALGRASWFPPRYSLWLFQCFGELRDVLGHRVVPHQKLSKLRALGNLEIDRLVNPLGGEIHGPHQALRIGRDVEILIPAQRRLAA